MTVDLGASTCRVFLLTHEPGSLLHLIAPQASTSFYCLPLNLFSLFLQAQVLLTPRTLCATASYYSDSTPMVESPDQLSPSRRIKAYVSRLGSHKANSAPVLPVTEASSSNGAFQEQQQQNVDANGNRSEAKASPVADEGASSLPPAPPPTTSASGEKPTTVAAQKKFNLAVRFYKNVKDILLASYFNVFLVFVPVGIAVQFINVSPTIVFAMNAIAIVPLAGLLAHATEAVASTLGDTIGALLNVTFGNAVELIIFIIALAKNEIRIVQASLAGSILANLLLILGMSFLFGGLRFREQIYNSTVTQMSACLLSLSVTSLLLPTAFHAAFSDNSADEADTAVVQLSRGSSVILLLVYVLYILFQLKSHAYMYESTPQHVIDEESHPGVLAEMLNSSSSSSTSSDSDDSSGSSGSHTTAKRIKRALRRRGRRKSSASSKDTPSLPSTVRTPSNGAISSIPSPLETGEKHQLGAIASGDEADDDDTPGHIGHFRSRVYTRDFGSPDGELEIQPRKKSKKRSKKKPRSKKEAPSESEKPTINDQQPVPSSPRVAFVQEAQNLSDGVPRRPFNIRTLSVRPTMPKMLSSTVFSTANPTGAAVPPFIPAIPKAPYGLRRTSSLPDRLNRSQSVPAGQQPVQRVATQNSTKDDADAENEQEQKPQLSRTAAVVLLLITTGLVALCAEFLVSSINYLVANTDVSEAFIGLILLPIVGNAAEHVTAVTVATKNKMDLAIGVAVGSSIQVSNRNVTTPCRFALTKTRLPFSSLRSLFY